MTATPKETEHVSNIHYFGPPAAIYSLRQGISDGFLSPDKVVRVHLDIDVRGWRPHARETHKLGQLIDDRIYNVKVFDGALAVDSHTQRTDALALQACRRAFLRKIEKCRTACLPSR